jgi:hypothetical protein
VSDDDFEPAEAPDELDADWRAALELLRATARAGLPAEGQRSRVAAELAAISEWVRLSVTPAERGAPVRGQGGQVRVRPDARQRAAPFHLFVDRALWEAIGQPVQVQIQVSGGALRILPATSRARWRAGDRRLRRQRGRWGHRDRRGGAVAGGEQWQSDMLRY